MAISIQVTVLASPETTVTEDVYKRQDQHYVDYIFSAYSGKKVPISFLKVDYTVDRPALLEALSAQDVYKRQSR